MLEFDAKMTTMSTPLFISHQEGSSYEVLEIVTHTHII